MHRDFCEIVICEGAKIRPLTAAIRWAVPGGGPFVMALRPAAARASSAARQDAHVMVELKDERPSPSGRSDRDRRPCPEAGTESSCSNACARGQLWRSLLRLRVDEPFGKAVVCERLRMTPQGAADFYADLRAVAPDSDRSCGAPPNGWSTTSPRRHRASTSSFPHGATQRPTALVLLYCGCG